MTESETTIEEHGVFKRKYWRKGKQRKQKTERLKKNPEKTVLYKIKDLEIYVYGEFPEKIFIGTYPNFTMTMEPEDLDKWFIAYNKMRWYFNDVFRKIKYPQKTSIRQIKAQRTREHIVSSYNLAQKRIRRKKKA